MIQENPVNKNEKIKKEPIVPSGMIQPIPLERDFKITSELELQANHLQINLEKLKAEIEKAGGIEEFRELADEGLRTFIDNGSKKRLPGNTAGEEQLRQIVSKLNGLKDTFVEKLAGGAGAVITGISFAGLNIDSLAKGNTELSENMLTVMLIGGIAMAGGSLVSVIRKKIEAQKQFLIAKEAELKLQMTGSHLENNYVSSYEENEKLRKETHQKNV